MNTNGPVNENMREVVKDIDSIVNEMITICMKPKNNKGTETLASLERLFSAKENEFQDLHERYLHRHKVKGYIQELEKVSNIQDQKLNILNNGIRSIYGVLNEVTRRVEQHTDYNKPNKPLHPEEIVKMSYLYSESNSVMSPALEVKDARPFPTFEEMKKGKLMMQTRSKQTSAKQQKQLNDPSYIQAFNHPHPMPMEEQLEKCRAWLTSSSKNINRNKKEKRKHKNEKRLKNEGSKVPWTHYRPRYRTVQNIEWSGKALEPMGFIENENGNTNGFDGGMNGVQNGILKLDVPEWPIPQFVPIHEKHGVYYKALIENDEEEDLFSNEERMDPTSVQSCDMVEADNFEQHKQYQEILEHSKQKYNNTLNENVPWLEKPEKEKRPKNSNPLFRLRTSAYFYQRRVTKRAVWNAKYNRFYRSHKFTSPKLIMKDYTFPHPRRHEGYQTGPCGAELSWNLRKWTLSTNIQPLNS